MTAGAGAVLPFGAGDGSTPLTTAGVVRRCAPGLQKRGAGLERGPAARMLDVLASAAVAGLASDAELDETARLKARSCLQDRSPQASANAVRFAAAGGSRRGPGR